MLEQMAKIVREEKPDVMLVCGDVYHTAQPSAAVQTMFTEALVKIRDANPGITIVVTAGNHDSGTKHEIFRTPWSALKVHTIGKADRDNPEDHIIEIAGKGYIIGVPYCNERTLPKDFFQKILDEVAKCNTECLPVVLTAHTTVKGCDYSGHDNATEYMVGGIDYMEVEEFGEGYDYLALGHIHRGQFVHTGKHNVRYSGTPIAVSFDEDYPHSVSLVDIEKHGDRPKVETIEILNPRPLVTLPSTGAADWEEAKRLLEEFPKDIPAYVRLNVEIDDFLPVEANAEATALTQDKACRFCHINARRKAGRKAEDRAISVQEFQAMAPIEIARQFAEDSKIKFDEDMSRLFCEVVKMIEEDERNS